MMASEYRISIPPTDPTERSRWCQNQLLERTQMILANQHLPINSKMKVSVRRRRKRLDDCRTHHRHTKQQSVANVHSTHVNKSRPTDCKHRNDSKRFESLQLFLYSDFCSPLVLSMNRTDPVSKLFDYAVDKFKLTFTSIRLATGNNFQLCEALSFEDHGIITDTNIYMRLKACCLRGGSDEKDKAKDEFAKRRNSDLPNIITWNREQVRQWLTSTVKLNKEYVDQFYEEEVDGETLLMYEETDLRNDFNMKFGPMLNLLQHRKELCTKDVSHFEPRMLHFPSQLDKWTITDVGRWLSSINLDEKYINKFKDEEIKGDALKLLTPQRLRDYFGMKNGPIRKYLYRMNDMLHVSERNVSLPQHVKDDLEGSVLETCEEHVPPTGKSHPHYTTSVKASIELHCDSGSENLGGQETEKACEQKATFVSKYSKNVPEDVKVCIDDLNKQLKLGMCWHEHPPDHWPCTLQIICGMFGKDANHLERLFCFLVLKKGQNELVQCQVQKMWEQIQNNVKQFIPLLPAEEQVQFDTNVHCEQGGVSRVSDKQQFMLRSKKLTVCPILQKSPKSRAMHTQLVLLVDHEILIHTHGPYGTYLDAKKDNFVLFNFGESNSYAASVHHIKDDLKIEIRKTRNKIPALQHQNKQLDTLPQPMREHLPSTRVDQNEEKWITMGHKRSKTSSKFESSQKQKYNPSPIPEHNREESFQTHQDIALGKQKPRLFDSQVENCTYVKRRILDVIETGVIDLIQPVHEYKQFTGYVQKERAERIWKFVTETIRFAAACINDRTNGTIHFGIADNKGNHAQHGQIFGIEVKNKTEYEEELVEFIKKCFDRNENIEIALKCIRPPRYVPVHSIETKYTTYVIEVDIVPQGTLCRDKAFYVRLPSDHTQAKLQRLSKAPSVLYRRIGSSTCKIENRELHDYLSSHIKLLISRREEAENSLEILPSKSHVKRHNLADKLIWLLCNGRKELDTSLYPILVVNQPTSYQRISQLKFVHEIDWVAVFDFDAESQRKGLCSLNCKDKHPNIQDPGMYLGITDVGAHRDEIGFPVKTCWLFCDGRWKCDERPSTSQLDWHLHKSKGVKDAIHFFANENVIPKDRAIVVFLILSQHYENMVETFGEFSACFSPESLMCVTDSDDIYQGWAREVTGRFFCSNDLLQERTIKGMPWKHVNETILQMMGVRQKQVNFIPSSTGAQIALKNREKEALRDLTILSSNECEEITSSMSQEEQQAFQREKELGFYLGHQVDWWNFWATDNNFNHVLKRDKHDDLKKHVQDALNPEPSAEVERISIISLYHQPGAGGTTLARNVLWEFRKSHRCATIQRVTQNTANQIIRFWLFAEQMPRLSKPVLIVVEPVDESVFRELLIEIEEVCINKGFTTVRKPVCIMILCKRCIFDDTTIKRTMKFESVSLEHALTENERIWFVKKLQQLEETQLNKMNEIQPHHLISFMILKENFHPKYVEDMVSGVLDAIDKMSPEVYLLKYVALLNTYISESIPVPCCDGLMDIGHYQANKTKKTRLLEYTLSKPTRLLLLEMQKFSTGSGKAYRIVHPLVAKEILKQMCIRADQDVADVTIEFLDSKLFQTNSYTKQDLQSMTTKMLKRRKKIEYKDEYETKFSPIIMDILKAGHPEKATDVLRKGMELFDDDFIMIQQVARLYLYRKEFEAAKKFAKQAVDRKPSNSFLLDTLGEVLRTQMNSSFLHVKACQMELDPQNAIKALNLAFGAIDVFHKSQKTSKTDRNWLNVLGYIKEVDTCFNLLEILVCVKGFHRPEKGMLTLRKYMVDIEFVPPFVYSPWDKFHKRMKELKSNIDRAVNHIRDYCVRYKDELLYDRVSIENLKVNLRDYSSKCSLYFGEMECNPPKNVDDISEWRRLRVSTLRCNHFFDIFDLVHIARKTKVKDEIIDKLKESKALLLSNDPWNSFDLHCIISLNLALSSLIPAKQAESLKTMWDLTQHYLRINPEGQIYPYYFLSLLLWPREDVVVQFDKSLFQKCTSEMKNYYSPPKRGRREPKYRTGPVTQYKMKPNTSFFLGREKGLRAFIHISELPLNGTRTSLERRGDRFWESNKVKKLLLRLKGEKCSSNIIRCNNILDDNKATIEIQPCISMGEVSSREPVSFYLGFSWAGPVAYYILPEDADDYETVSHDQPEASPDEETELEHANGHIYNYNHYRHHHSKLKGELETIKRLKEMQNGGKTLEKAQLLKIQKEETLEEELLTLESEYKKYKEAHSDFLDD